MPRNIVLAGWPARGPLARIAPQWRMPLTRLALAWAGLLAFLRHDWAAMSHQWWDSSTYNHILLVPAILIWLVWLRRSELAKLQPESWWPGLLVTAAALFAWLLGVISGLDLARQLGAVAALQGAAAAALGPRAVLGLLFPLSYMFFLVPFGDELIPALQMITARITIALTHASGIPADIDGVFIDTPVGLFEVAEACSGVKFLIAMVALGGLAAQVCFKSWGRRVSFLALCMVVPVLANGVRAWGTIYIAQFRGVEFAAGFDHIFYGWIFFALVMAAVLGLAWRFFDRPADDSFINAAAITDSPIVRRLPAGHIGGGAMLAGLTAIVLLAALWAGLAGRLSATTPRQIALPEVAGWQRADYRPQVWWEPRAEGASHRLLGSYADPQGRKVDVFFALYSRQDETHDAGGFGQGALRPESPWSWQRNGEAMPGAPHSEWLMAGGHVERLAVTFYRTGNVLTGSKARLKLATMGDRLLLRERPTMLLILSAEEQPGQPAAQSVAAFRAAAGPTGEWMDRIGLLR